MQINPWLPVRFLHTPINVRWSLNYILFLSTLMGHKFTDSAQGQAISQ